MDKDDEVIKEEVKDKADEGPNNENFSYKSNEIKYNRINLNEKYEGKKSFTGIELVQLLKNPFKFQKRIIRNNNFDSIYKKVDKIQKELGIMDDDDSTEDEDRIDDEEYDEDDISEDELAVTEELDATEELDFTVALSITLSSKTQRTPYPIDLLYGWLLMT